YLVGAALSWCADSFDKSLLVSVLSRDVFRDPTQRTAKAALALGFAHRKFKYFAPNVTPFGTVIAAPPPEQRELFCRDGLKYYARIPEKRIRAALYELKGQHTRLRQSSPKTAKGQMLKLELDFATRMAEQSCRIMLWQQAIAGQKRIASKLARKGVQDLKDLEEGFTHYWPSRNKGTIDKCAAFLRWRREDFQKGRLHFPPQKATL